MHLPVDCEGVPVRFTVELFDTLNFSDNISGKLLSTCDAAGSAECRETFWWFNVDVSLMSLLSRDNFEFRIVCSSNFLIVDGQTGNEFRDDGMSKVYVSLVRFSNCESGSFFICFFAISSWSTRRRGVPFSMSLSVWAMVLKLIRVCSLVVSLSRADSTNKNLIWVCVWTDGINSLHLSSAGWLWLLAVTKIRWHS